METVSIALGKICTSRVGMGTASLHHLFRSKDRQALLESAWDLGIRYFDTAPLYAHGTAETEIGRFAKGRRDQLTIVTKYGLLPNPLYRLSLTFYYARKAAGKLPLVPALPPPPRDFCAAGLRAQVNHSLRRLATDYIDVLLLHEPELVEIREPLALADCLRSLKQEGLIRNFGLSTRFDAFLAIRQAYPDIAAFAQVQFADDHQSPEVIRPDASFGHFYPRNIDGAMASMALPNGRRKLTDLAVRLNPSGVILFSSRRTEHLRETVAGISLASTAVSVEPQ